MKLIVTSDRNLLLVDDPSSLNDGDEIFTGLDGATVYALNEIGRIRANYKFVLHEDELAEAIVTFLNTKYSLDVPPMTHGELLPYCRSQYDMSSCSTLTDVARILTACDICTSEVGQELINILKRCTANSL